MTSKSTDIEMEPCPVCGRALIDGPSVERHHVVPKSKSKGKPKSTFISTPISTQGHETVTLHAVCHRMLHKLFSEGELAALGPIGPAHQKHPDMQRFVRWIQKKPPTFTDRPRTRQRRPYHKSR